jgi:hypothetical protein
MYIVVTGVAGFFVNDKKPVLISVSIMFYLMTEETWLRQMGS